MTHASDQQFTEPREERPLEPDEEELWRGYEQWLDECARKRLEEFA